MARRTLPQQAIPTLSLLCETFTYKYGEVVGDCVDIHTTRDYFFRPRICYSAWRNKKIKDLNCILGNHPLEDVLHIHAWVQTHYMHTGKLPSSFYFMPKMIPRSAELVPGRIYPLVGESGNKGTICVCPGGRAFALVAMADEEPTAMGIENWHIYLRLKNIQVAPLIYRKHALLQGDDKTLRILKSRPVQEPSGITEWMECYSTKIHTTVGDDNYLDYEGNYDIGDETIPWDEAHPRLVALGTHIFATKDSVKKAIPEGRAKLPGGDYTHVVGWLRYPDECDAKPVTDNRNEERFTEINENKFIYIAFRVSAKPNECDDVCVLGIPPEHCKVVEDTDLFRSVDTLTP